MTLTHVSHFCLTIVNQTAESIMFAGSLAACKRMAFAHGMEIERYVGVTLSMDGRHAVYAPVDMTKPAWIHFRNGGLIHRGQDDYMLLMPIEVWNQK